MFSDTEKRVKDKAACKSGSLAAFCGRVTLVHFLSYSLVGALFFFLRLNMMVYYESNPDPAMQGYQEIFRATDSVLVAAGPLFQILRGLLFGLVLYPFRETLITRKWGWAYLWALFLVLALFSTIGPAPGSIEGLIYTHVPLSHHLLTPWEGALQTLVFSLLLIRWEKSTSKRLTQILVLVSIMLLAGIVVGVIQAI
ncbi:MAG: hypothetical protein V3V47_04610 [Desulfobacteria bacterium]